MAHRYLFALLLPLFVCTCDSAPKDENNANDEEKLPNLLIVLSDQHSYDMLGTYGNTQIKTPNLDRFAAEGIRFDRAFTNQPVCTPYRGMIMSGMQPLKNGAFINDAPLLPNKTKLLAQVLKDKGYQTAYIGKWHLLGGERDRPIPEGDLRYGFDKVLTNNCHVDFRAGKAFFWNEKDEKEFFDKWEVYGQTDQALAYLDTVDTDKPFALVVSWHPPHDWGKFKGVDGKMHYRYDTDEEMMAVYDRDSIQLRPGIERTPDRLHMYHGYMAATTGVDKAFGQLMDKLREKGMEENTLALFSADHGDMLESHHAILPKQYPHDYSTRIPFLVRYPAKIEAGQSTDLLFGALDIMPTLLGLLDVDTPQEYDGKNLANEILTGNEDAVDELPIWVYKRGVAKNQNWRGVITPEYTFSMGRGVDSLEITNVLFDRNADPNQLNNLFHDPAHHDVREELRQKTFAWMRKYNDQFWGVEEFLRIRPEETWMYNYTQSPFELFAEEGR
ncbi:sulfatase-like hydrolase/transferase [Neolewinella antarctica]|uniref:Arylsulfatase A-like enzyme n=1 Tax=Neolewinella antarctica TaxID=442734 RepID=A0ABX0XG94_9BACT|nr:sulfatase-like hydrolase/transferase [Neolewinella antarctica]NJC28330.1 arylsulfatase A-like enzyme [Neolewinella antarctica]